jgi:hypothetical protein
MKVVGTGVVRVSRPIGAKGVGAQAPDPISCRVLHLDPRA